MEKIVWQSLVIKAARGRVEKIDSEFVYFLGERGKLIIPKKDVLEISERKEKGGE